MPPLLTADLPGCGGAIRAKNEDFEVDEVPSYEPCGEGEHLFLWVEKRGMAPEFFARTIAQRLGISPAAVGTAGLKDRHAITRQWVSVPHDAEPRLAKLDSDDLRVLRTGRHTNKLKPGHLRGNRFNILIRNPNPDAKDSTNAILDRIRTLGLPNFYGPQRFGRDGSTLDLGWQCLAGKASRRIRPFLFRFALSSVQSFLFNDVLARRLWDGLYRKVIPGDVMAKWPAGGMFTTQDPAAEQLRFDAKEIVTAGPMFGKKTFPAEGVAAAREAAVLSDNGLSIESFGGFGKLALGTRRHNLVYLDDLVADWGAEGLRLTFTLPAGSYATVLLQEVMKAPVEVANEEPDEE